jgi:hypothetical protein
MTNIDPAQDRRRQYKHSKGIGATQCTSDFLMKNAYDFALAFWAHAPLCLEPCVLSHIHSSTHPPSLLPLLLPRQRLLPPIHLILGIYTPLHRNSYYVNIMTIKVLQNATRVSRNRSEGDGAWFSEAICRCWA